MKQSTHNKTRPSDNMMESLSQWSSNTLKHVDMQVNDWLTERASEWVSVFVYISVMIERERGRHCIVEFVIYSSTYATPINGTNWNILNDKWSNEEKQNTKKEAAITKQSRKFLSKFLRFFPFPFIILVIVVYISNRFLFRSRQPRAYIII